MKFDIEHIIPLSGTANRVEQEPDGTMVQYYQSGENLNNRSALIRLGDFSNIVLEDEPQRFTSSLIQMFGTKHLINMGAYGFYILRDQSQTFIRVPINQQRGGPPPTLTAIEQTLTTIKYHITNPDIMVWEWFRLVFRNGEFAHEFVVYDWEGEVEKPFEMSGEYEVTVQGFRNEVQDWSRILPAQSIDIIKRPGMEFIEWWKYVQSIIPDEAAPDNKLITEKNVKRLLDELHFDETDPSIQGTWIPTLPDNFAGFENVINTNLSTSIGENRWFRVGSLVILTFAFDINNTGISNVISSTDPNKPNLVRPMEIMIANAKDNDGNDIEIPNALFTHRMRCPQYTGGPYTGVMRAYANSNTTVSGGTNTAGGSGNAVFDSADRPQPWNGSNMPHTLTLPDIFVDISENRMKFHFDNQIQTQIQDFTWLNAVGRHQPTDSGRNGQFVGTIMYLAEATWFTPDLEPPVVTLSHPGIDVGFEIAEESDTEIKYEWLTVQYREGAEIPPSTGIEIVLEFASGVQIDLPEETNIDFVQDGQKVTIKIDSHPWFSEGTPMISFHIRFLTLKGSSRSGILLPPNT